MPEFSKSTRTPDENTLWYDSLINELAMDYDLRDYKLQMKEELKEIRESIKAVQDSISNMTIMYRRPGSTQHESIVDYLNSVETRLTTIEMRQELDV